jgi:hypothetical protein
MFSLMGITGRSAYLTRQVASLESQMSTSPSDPVRNELNETRSRLGLVKEQHEEWEFDTQVRQHNHVGLVRRFRSYHLRDLMADIVFNW